ncbi:MAG: PorT family protein [Gemmatimonadaceae bacterium]|nr:PorT family protein [Chitinophagaceae bacterium]
MKQKHFLLLMIAVASSVIASAQATKTTFGLRAGVNFQNINGRDINDDKLENSLIPGFHVGVNAEIPVATEFYFQPGILFSTKGSKGYYADEDAKVMTSYVEVPLNFLYKGGLGAGKVLLGFGPYVAYGLGGKVKDSNTGDYDIKFKNDPPTVTNDVYLKPFDAGANFLAGYEFSNKFSLQLNAQLGLLDFNAYDNDAKLKNTGFGISAGYRF